MIYNRDTPFWSGTLECKNLSLFFSFIIFCCAAVSADTTFVNMISLCVQCFVSTPDVKLCYLNDSFMTIIFFAFVIIIIIIAIIVITIMAI